MPAMLRLVEIADQYLACRVGLSSRYRQAVESIARKCQRECARGKASLDQRMAAYLQRLAREGRSLYTIRTHRAVLLALMRYAHQMQVIPGVPRLPEVRVPQTLPRAWSAEEVARLVEAAAGLPGRRLAWCDVPDCDYFAALLAMAWYTAARLGSLLAIRWDDLDLAQGLVLLRAGAHKTLQDQVLPIPRELAAWLDRLPRCAREVWPVPRRQATLHRWFRRIARRAGIQVPPGHGSCFQRLRRSAITAAAACHGLEAARRLAGHSSASLTLRHYVDPRYIASGPAVPPIRLPRPRAVQLRLFD
jgi:integrase